MAEPQLFFECIVDCTLQSVLLIEIVWVLNWLIFVLLKNGVSRFFRAFFRLSKVDRVVCNNYFPLKIKYCCTLYASYLYKRSSFLTARELYLNSGFCGLWCELADSRVRTTLLTCVFEL